MSRPSQPITAELRAWIVEQTSAGLASDAVVESMLASGWDEAVAIQALDSTLREHLAQQARAASQPAPAKVPDPLPEGTCATVWALDREVTVVAALRQPRVVVFANLLDGAECDEIVTLARARLARSETVQIATGSSEVNDARTSDGMFFHRGEHAVCARVEARIAALVGWPVENGEGLQVLRYRAAAEYKPHYDYFDPAHPGTPSILRRGGQRVASLVCYLNTPPRGGSTTFPEVGLEVAPVQGHAVFFSYDRPDPSTRSLHGGAPVLEGEKWVATKWLREGRFD